MIDGLGSSGSFCIFGYGRFMSGLWGQETDREREREGDGVEYISQLGSCEGDTLIAISHTVHIKINTSNTYNTNHTSTSHLNQSM